MSNHPAQTRTDRPWHATADTPDAADAADAALRVTYDEVDGVHHVVLTGALTAYTGHLLRRVLVRRLEAGYQELRVDLRRVRELDPAGLVFLTAPAARLARAHSTLAIVAPDAAGPRALLESLRPAAPRLALAA